MWRFLSDFHELLSSYEISENWGREGTWADFHELLSCYEISENWGREGTWA